jgi:predicted N-acyltransferase
VQFHWRNNGFRDFQDFLDSLSQPKRKKIRAERRKVAEAGVICQLRYATVLTEHDWDFFYACYENTYLAHGNPPYFSRGFFQHLAKDLPDQIVIATAHPEGNLEAAPIAASLLMTQNTAAGVTAYGRYWGSVAQVSMLHFELAYYAPIQWAIANHVQIIEGGAQGEHKMARGFEPVAVRSSHWISEPRFRDAVARFLAREGKGVEGYLSELNDRLPFK